MKIKKSTVYAEFLEISEQSYYRWKNKHHPKLIKFLEDCFSDEEINEYNKNSTIPFYIEKKYDIYDKDYHEYVNLILDYEENLYPYFLLLNDYILKRQNKYLSFISFREYVLQCFSLKIISLKDLNFFLETQEQLIKVWNFIIDNISSEWKLLNNMLIRDDERWVITFHKLQFEAAKKGLYRKIFMSYNIDGNDEVLVPLCPEPFTLFYASDELANKYNIVLQEMLDTIINNEDIHKYKKYNILEQTAEYKKYRRDK